MAKQEDLVDRLVKQGKFGKLELRLLASAEMKFATGLVPYPRVKISKEEEN